MGLGTALSLEKLSSKMVAPVADPWPLVDAIIRGKTDPPQRSYQPDLDAVRDSWVNLHKERRALLMVLSRFALTPNQAIRWFDNVKRAEGTATYRA